MNRVVIQQGYNIPFNGAGKRKKRRSGKRRMSGAMLKQQSKMKACAREWDGAGSYRSFMKDCLRGD